MADRKTIQAAQEDLEEAAVQTWLEIMGNSQYAPEVRAATAEKALRALGKAEPAKQSGATIVFNFGDHMAKALMGIGQTLELMRPADEQHTAPARDEADHV